MPSRRFVVLVVAMALLACSEAAAENADSRVLVGFHFRHATTSGTTHGLNIGRYVVRNFLEPAYR